ncbi:MAG TPA: 4Fe-4S binding protein [Bacillota bacterium]|nr:4Fe-4S binding protein [Bacillota bacterium]
MLAKLKSNRTLRLAVQAFIVLLFITAAVEFYSYYEYVVYGSGSTYRPPVVEGFLPVAALVAFQALLGSGFMDQVHPAGLMIFVAILVTAWIFRRAMCAWFCPLGSLSESLGKLGERVMGRSLRIPKWLDIILLVLKYALILKIAKLFIMPGEQAVAFTQAPYYAISDVKMFEFFLNIGLKGLLFVGLLMLLSFLFKSFWCRYLCPYGAILGVLGFLSPIVLKKNSTTCIQCGKCNKVCPSKVDVMGKKNLVLTSECVGCTSCVANCPKEKTLEFRLLGLVPVKPWTFGAGFVVIFFGIIFWAMATGHWQSTVTPQDYQAIYRGMSSAGF